MKSLERFKRFKHSAGSANGDGKSDRDTNSNNEGRPLKSFSPAEVYERREEWQSATGQIYEELNWENDKDVLAIYTRANKRSENLDQATLEELDQILSDETDRFVDEHPEKAKEYQAQWERWAEVAGINPKINDAEWKRLARMNPGSNLMGQYRSIAHAVYRREKPGIK